MLNPTVQSGMVDFNATLLQHFLQVSITNPILAIPAYCPQNNLTFKLSSFEIVHAEPLDCSHYFNKNENHLKIATVPKSECCSHCSTFQATFRRTSVFIPVSHELFGLDPFGNILF